MYPYSIFARNVNEAMSVAIKYFCDKTIVRRIAPRDPSKVTLEINAPVCTTYQYPLERVLFSPQRDANPFFHFFEALWILDGRRDVEWLANFLPKMREYSDDGRNFHGAYGARMRRAHIEGAYVDQLGCVVAQLKHDPDSRRAVVGIWQPEHDSGYSGKDMPCNCTLAFKIRDGKLNLTIFNRSNDMVWGAYGANVVQFSTVLEYIAGMVGVPVGTMFQWSDSFHVYEAEPAWQRIKGMGYVRIDPYKYAPGMYPTLGKTPIAIDGDPVRPFPLVRVPEAFDAELMHFCNRVKNIFNSTAVALESHAYENVYLDTVARPLLNAFLAHRRKEQGEALGRAFECAATDWRLAAVLWLYRRYFQGDK